MKKTLLEITQEIIDFLNGQQVGSINDTLEATQIANIIRSTFENLYYPHSILEHKEFLRVEDPFNAYGFTLSSPSHLKGSFISLDRLWYNVGDNTNPEYKELYYVPPLEFVSRTDSLQEDFDLVFLGTDAGHVKVGNKDNPEFYTSFDDVRVLLNSRPPGFEHNIRAYGTLIPEFVLDDNFIPPIDADKFPELIEESKAVAFEVMKGYVPAKVEQHARRARYITRDKGIWSIGRWANYSRPS